MCEEAAKKDVQNVISQYVPELQCNIVCVEAEVSANSIDMLKAARPHLSVPPDLPPICTSPYFCVIGSLRLK